MGYKVDDQQVVDMSKLHSNKFIAGRLGISVRQVSRILKKNKASKDENNKRKRTMDGQTEAITMQFYRSCGESYGQIAGHFGISRQAVQQKLTHN